MVTQVEAIKEQFTCNCGGEVKVIDEEHIKHDCRSKYAPSGSYYTGVPCFVPYHRVQINLALTNGLVRYNWFVEYEANDYSKPDRA